MLNPSSYIENRYSNIPVYSIMHTPDPTPCSSFQILFGQSNNALGQ